MKFRGHFGTRLGSGAHIDYVVTVDSQEIENLMKQSLAGDTDAGIKAAKLIHACEQEERYWDWLKKEVKKGNPEASTIVKYREYLQRETRNFKIFQVVCILIFLCIVFGIIYFIIS